MGKTEEIKGCAGVAFFGVSSLGADLKALEWAFKRLPLSNKYNLRIIHVNKLNNTNPPQERSESRYNFDGVETEFRKNCPGYSEKEMKELLGRMKKHKVERYICGVAYEGENFEEALQCAIKNEGLDVLVLAWWEEDATKRQPINKLESGGCSIILLNVDSSKRLTLSMPPTASTEVSANTTAPCPDRETEGSHSKRSNMAQQASSSETDARPPAGRDI